MSVHRNPTTHRVMAGAALALGAMIVSLPAALAQPQGGGASNSMAAAVVQDHIFLRPGETILVRMGYSGGDWPESCSGPEGRRDGLHRSFHGAASAL